MKKIAIAAAVLAASASAAFAGSHEDGKANPRGKWIEAVDLNKDGGIDSTEFSAAAAKRAETRFDELDADKNGSVTRDEYIAGAERQSAERFVRMDRNGDGALTKDDHIKRDHRNQAKQEPAPEPQDAAP